MKVEIVNHIGFLRPQKLPVAVDKTNLGFFSSTTQTTSFLYRSWNWRHFDINSFLLKSSYAPSKNIH